MSATNIATIPEVLQALREGKPVIVADGESRENEGDAIMGASFANKEWLAWFIRYTSGYLCAPLTNAIADRLELPVMVSENRDPLGTNYTVSVDAADRASTGISAADRAHTLTVLADPLAGPHNLNRPGHILPLRANDGGVRARPGHTEATVELLTLAGLPPVGVIGELVMDNGDMMRMPQLQEFGQREGVLVTTIEALITYLETLSSSDATAVPTPPEPAPNSPDLRVSFEVETTLPTRRGTFRVRAYRDRATGADHLAIIADTPTRDGIPVETLTACPAQTLSAADTPVQTLTVSASTPDAAFPPLVRVHSECLTGEAFGSLKCECGPQLDAALERIQEEGGIVIYLRGHEGRGIGLVNKLRAYALQEQGLDTLDANLALGLPVDARDYGAASAILDELGIDTVRLLTNNPDKVAQLQSRGITVAERVPLVVGIGDGNVHYLETKRNRLGHDIDLALLKGQAR